MTDTLASPTWIGHQVGEAPTPPALGFPTALVVGATGERIAQLCGRRPVDARPVQGQYAMRRLPAYLLHVTGGTVALERTVPTYESDDGTPLPRARQGVLWDVAGSGDDDEAVPEPDAPARVIREWSRRSRARMVRAIAEIDHDTWSSREPLLMVTLTLPGQWEAVAPTGRAFKRLFASFARRWRRAIGSWQCVWKLEFQGRGAPHIHLLTRPPAKVGRERFQQWLSRTWADVCAHPDPEQRRRHEAAGTNVDARWRVTDPKRVAVYFLKHSSKTADSKEYQHVVPAEWREAGKGPGRFWGVAGLGRVRATVELEERVFYQLRRELRKLHRAQRAKTALDRRRARLATMRGETWRRPTIEDLAFFGLRSDRLLRSARGGGFVVVNDAPAVAHKVAKWLATRTGVAIRPQVSEP